MEIAPFTIADSVDEISKSARERIKQLSRKNNIEIIGTHWLFIKPEGLSIFSANKDIRKKTSLYFEKLVGFTSDIGGKIMVFGSPKQRYIDKDIPQTQVMEYFFEFIKDPLEVAREKNITICLEPLAKRETNFVNSVTDAISIIETLNHPNLKLILDVKAMSDEKRPYPEIIYEGRKHLCHFHANDENLLGPGFGKIDFAPIISALKDIHYNGYLSVEVFNFAPGPEEIAKKSIEYLKKFL